MTSFDPRYTTTVKINNPLAPVISDAVTADRQRIAEKVRAMKKSVGLLRLESVEKTDRDYYAQKRDYETYNQALDDVLKILEEEYAVGK